MPAALRRLTVALTAVALGLLLSPAASRAGTANARLSSSPNPLAEMAWPGYHSDTTDPQNDPPSAYFNATGDKRLTPYLQMPRARWFGSWVPMHDRYVQGRLRWGIYRTIRNYIDTVTRGRSDVGVQIGIFRLEPFERAVGTRVPSRRERAEYRAWIRKVAAAIRSRNARVALVLQPDLPLALHQPDGGRVQLGLVNWTTRVFSSLARTTVYLDAGSADWERVGTASRMLRRAGVARARGFALGLTHYDSTARQVAYGRKLVQDLARHGIRNRHFVVSTAMNGRGFTFQRHRRTFKRGTICRSRDSRACVTLGQPFTTDTATPQADAYMWLGRSWYRNATIRTHDELLRLVRTSPWF